MPVQENQVVTLNMQEDFAGKLATERPVQAIAELIWNGLDAEATNIKVTAEADELKTNSITVQDNGHRMSRVEAVRYFENLGGSWKKAITRPRLAYDIYMEKKARGRLRALALERVAEWTVTGKNEEGSLETFHVVIIRDNIRSARMSPAIEAKRGTQSGTRILVTELNKDWRLDAPGVAQEISELFALYMTEYPDVSISVDGHKIDPAAAISHKQT